MEFKKTPRELLAEAKSSVIPSGRIKDTIVILFKLLERMIEDHENIGDNLIKDLKKNIKID